jgi:TonB family protein
MKKALIPVFAILTAASTAFAQDTTWFNTAWKTTTRDKASYYRTTIKTDSGWQLTDHFLSGIVQMAGSYADDSFHIAQGEVKWYDKNGAILHSRTYVKGKADGKEAYYYPNGHINAIGNNKDDKEQGEWLGYYRGGKLSARAVYDTGRQVSASFYNEDGSRNKDMKVFMKESEYPGGLNHYIRWLNRTLRYPDSAVVHEIQGTVVIGFKVSKDGRLSEFKVDQSVDKYLDQESLRALRLMPEWEPSIIGGIFTDSYRRQPVVFRLEAQ